MTAPGSVQAGGPPIFLVGVARSGTTLLATMLGAHPHLDCGPESRFFYGLRTADAAAIVNDPAWPSKALELIRSLVTAQQPVLQAFGLEERAVRAYLEARPPSVAAVLESITATHAARAGKPRWVEKSTDHLVRGPEIRASFPDAPIIRIVRDPRDSALSLTGIRFGSQSYLANLEFWRKRDAASHAFFERDARSLTVRYEDLLTDPRAVLTRVTDFIGEPFDEQMLGDRDAAAEAVRAPGESYKGSVAKPLDLSRIEVWRRSLTPEMSTAAAVFCREGIQRYGYPDAADATRLLAVFPWNHVLIEANEATLVTLLGRHVDLVPLAWGTARRPTRERELAAVWGRSGELGRRQRGLRGSLGLLALASALRVRRRRLLWVDATNGARPAARPDRLVAFLLGRLASRLAPGALPDVAAAPLV